MKKVLSLMAMVAITVAAMAQNLTEFVKDSYAGKVVVTINEESTAPIEANVVITKKGNNIIDFTLENFVLKSEDGEIPVGNVHLTDIPLNKTENNSEVSIKTTQTTTISEGTLEGVEIWLGPLLGELPIDLSGVMAGDDVNLDIDLDLRDTDLNQLIHVDFLAGRYLEDIEQDPNPTPGPDPKPDPIDPSKYYVTNGSFDGEWVNCYPWEAGAFVKTARGTQPAGWCIANVNGVGGLGATVVGATGDDRNAAEESSAVVLTNTPNPWRESQIVPGYISLGTAWATAKASLFSVSAADGGVFGGVEFTSKPDALKLYYKRQHNVKAAKNYTNLTEKATVVAYTWKGTWTQNDVPSNTSMGNPTKVTMTDRSNNILGKACLTGGEISKTEDAELVAMIEYYIEGDANDWTELVIPFDYKNAEATPEKMNIILSANDLFADRSKIGSGNQLMVDDVQFVYNSEIAKATFAGEEVKFADGIANVSGNYSEADFTVESNGRGATVEKAYDESTKTLTITVKGQDYEADNTNYHVYKVNFTTMLAGDVNGDGSVTKEDADAVVNAYLGNKPEVFNEDAADMNDDGKITMEDANAIVNIYLSK